MDTKNRRRKANDAEAIMAVVDNVRLVCKGGGSPLRSNGAGGGGSWEGVCSGGPVQAGHEGEGEGRDVVPVGGTASRACAGAKVVEGWRW